MTALGHKPQGPKEVKDGIRVCSAIQGRASRRRLAAVDEDEYVNPMEDLEAEDRDLSLGDEDGNPPDLSDAQP